MLLSPLALLSQGWEKDYGDYQQQSGLAIDLCADGNVVVAGINKKTSGNSTQYFIHKIDPSGKLLWEYCDSIRNDFFPTIRNIVSTSDSNFLISVNHNREASYIHKISPNGTLLWEFDVFTYDEAITSRIIESKNGGFLILNLYPKTAANLDFETSVIKLSNDGQLIWEKKVTSSNINFFGRDFVETPEDDIMIIGDQEISDIERMVAVKLDENGNLIWENYDDSFIAGTVYRIINSTDGGFTISGLNTEFQIQLTKLDSNGSGVWTKSYPELNKSFSYKTGLVQSPDGGYAVSAEINYELLGPRDMVLLKVDANGTQQWLRKYGTSITQDIFSTGLVRNGDQGYYLSGFNESPGGSIASTIFLVKTDSIGYSFTNELSGNVYHDSNLDCEKNDSEEGLSQWLVEANNGSLQYLTYTDSFGNYTFRLDSGNYEISVIPNSSYWSICNNIQSIYFDGFFQNKSVHFGAQAVINCPLLDVSIGTPFLRRCAENIYSIQYCNHGTTIAEDSYVEVMLDDLFQVTFTSIPISNQTGNIYTFDLGDIDVNECGNFSIQAFLGDSTMNCAGVPIGQTLCTEAHIFPDSICMSNPGWSGASIEVDAVCQEDSIFFTITNVGTATTTAPLTYIIIEDDVILYADSVTLDQGQNEVIPIGTNGSTFRMEVEQEPAHPGNSMPSISVEGCGDDFTIFNLGYINIFNQDDGNPFIDIDCEIINGPYDPNDKQGFPLGRGDENYIDPNQTIDYKIRFQNTGTDTAFNVIVRDTLTNLLDWTTIRPGASSHPYTYSINTFGALEFKFDNIMLPDSNVNQLGSNGFVKFRVKPVAGLPLETEIYNSAAIYFDYNAPIITNETLHTLGQPLLATTALIDKIATADTKVSVAPNPFDQYTILSIEGIGIKNGIFQLFDVNGRLLISDRFEGNEYELNNVNLIPGMYFFSLKSGNQQIATGKLIRQ